MDTIRIRGARTHNLKNISLDIPRDALIVITGLSGSGKSSLAFDTLYSEGQRRYVESLSAYARQFLSVMDKPDVDHIDGLSPAISIEQKSTSHNPRSTVGTITEIHDYLRLLFARIGTPYCPKDGIDLSARTVSQMVDEVLALPGEERLMLLAPMVRQRKGEHVGILDKLRQNGFVRARVDGVIYDLNESIPSLDKQRKHTVEAVVDRFKVRPDISSRLAESFETALQLSDGLGLVVPAESTSKSKDSELLFSSRYACSLCGYSIDELEPRNFSFNNPKGACPDCDGLGVHSSIDLERILNPDLSMEDGAVRGWDRRVPYYYQMLKSVAEHIDVSFQKPFKALPQKARTQLLQGTGSERITFRYVTESGKIYKRKGRFEGVIPHMERRHRETESERQRKELAQYMGELPCPSCNGLRLREQSRHVFIQGTNLPTISALTIEKAYQYFETLKLSGQQKRIADKIVREIQNRLRFLIDVGLNYLSLDRSASTLSGGEAQRIRLASQIGAGLVGVLYILDEPSIGLHQRDNARLLKTLKFLRDIGNTVVVVEHDEEAIRSADHIVDIGPGAGVHGGEIVAQGRVSSIRKNKNSLTGKYLEGTECIAIPKKRTKEKAGERIVLRGANGNNLRNVNVEIPLGLMVCVTGVSGSGKSSLINGTLYPVLASYLNRISSRKSLGYESMDGLEKLDKCIDINQSPIGRTPRSNPATYTGLFTPVRELFSNVPEARTRGYQPGRFSFNVRGGRCEACRGDGLIRVEMHFLPDIYVPCDLCHSKRYNRETLEINYKGKNIHEVLEMTVEQALVFFKDVPTINRQLQTLVDVGLSYVKLGQSATTISGGEAQRVKLSSELSKRSTGKTMYILDEPTTGLHFHDIRQLLQVLHRLRDQGNTVLVIEHNMDVIKTADWIIDMGPEGGSGGGQIVACGTPENIARHPSSHTGHFLKDILKSHPSSKTKRASNA